MLSIANGLKSLHCQPDSGCHCFCDHTSLLWKDKGKRRNCFSQLQEYDSMKEWACKTVHSHQQSARERCGYACKVGCTIRSAVHVTDAGALERDNHRAKIMVEHWRVEGEVNEQGGTVILDAEQKRAHQRLPAAYLLINSLASSPSTRCRTPSRPCTCRILLHCASPSNTLQLSPSFLSLLSAAKPSVDTEQTRRLSHSGRWKQQCQITELVVIWVLNRRRRCHTEKPGCQSQGEKKGHKTPDHPWTNHVCWKVTKDWLMRTSLEQLGKS